ncbi:MAG: winged helix-turn-helix transcriptional regulator [Microthrixaceae bacterium]
MSTETDVHDLDWRSVCSITSGLDVLGDKWSLLIVRDLIAHGTRTYSEFRESPEHVATNILAARLRLLTSLGIIERTNPDGAARNNAYRLTPSGAALRPVLEELGKWAQTYLKQYHSEMVNSV